MTTDILTRWGRFAARHPWTVIGGWLVTALVVAGASLGFGADYEDSFGAPGLDSQRAADLLASSGADEGGVPAHVALSPYDADASIAAGPARAEMADLKAELEALPNVRHVGERISPDERIAVLDVQYPALEQLSPADLDRFKETVAEARAGSSLQLETGGPLFFAFEESGSGGGELIGIAAAVVILALAFGSLVAMGLPIVSALVGLGVGATALSLVAHVIDVPTWAPVIGSMVGLGVGIDYALFLVTRHREHLAEGNGVVVAAGRAMATAGRAVALAGGTVVVSILGLIVAGVPFVTAGAIAVSLIVLVMMTASLTLVPALLGLAGLRINRRSRRSARESRRWWRWGEHVSRHPWPYALGGTVLLLALAAPVLDLRMGNPDDGSFPTDRTERRAYDLIAEGFGPGVNGPLVIAVDTAGDPGALGPLQDAVADDVGIARVAPPELDEASGIASMVAIPTTGPQAEATVDTLHRLREDVLPTALDDSPATAHIGGQTAAFADLGDQIGDRLPWFVAAVIVLSCALLSLVFRSVVVPLKAALFNLLGIGAAYGVMVMVFQWGWGADLIGLESTVPVVSFIPMFMFAILFGLSMDYEVFLLSRIRERYDETGEPVRSVVHGIASTARVITSAALIMVAVFLGFVAGGSDPFTKMFGLGLATAIAIDATLVRLVLVPSVMALLGRAAWWLPRRLRRTPGRGPGGAQPAPEEPAPELLPS
ncbi:MMPL family transporter [Nocardioides sp. GXQ0305]|uniref:MMPL family transporter n=1 Tax=Nocardioides sp. GXQ0305 TaxID=3423912 RepID=UPI003D7C3DE3